MIRGEVMWSYMIRTEWMQPSDVEKLPTHAPGTPVPCLSSSYMLLSKLLSYYLRWGTATYTHKLLSILTSYLYLWVIYMSYLVIIYTHELLSISKTSKSFTMRGWSRDLWMLYSRRACLRIGIMQPLYKDRGQPLRPSTQQNKNICKCLFTFIYRQVDTRFTRQQENKTMATLDSN